MNLEPNPKQEELFNMMKDDFLAESAIKKLLNAQKVLRRVSDCPNTMSNESYFKKSRPDGHHKRRRLETSLCKTIVLLICITDE